MPLLTENQVPLYFSRRSWQLSDFPDYEVSCQKYAASRRAEQKSESTSNSFTQPTTGCPLPPAMTPPISGGGYVDSPLFGQPNDDGTGRLPGTLKMTGVAVSRNKCQQKMLSTYYFEFSILAASDSTTPNPPAPLPRPRRQPVPRKMKPFANEP